MLTPSPRQHSLSIPPGFSLIEKGRLSILLKNEYRQHLLTQGIDDPEHLIAGADQSVDNHLRGRGQLSAMPLAGTDGVRMLGKRCMRGGLVRHLSNDIFWSGNRPFEEMIANRIILERGIKTAEIIAAAQQRLSGPFYRGYLFLLEIPGCVNLITYFDGRRGNRAGAEDNGKAAVLEAVARALSTMHNRGVYHGDLHLKNVLLRPAAGKAVPEVYLIDFDKAIIKDRLSPRERISNVLRFNRSMEKYRFCGGAITPSDQETIYRAYLMGNESLEDLFFSALRRSGTLLKLRRYAWRLSTPRDLRGKSMS